MQNKLDYISFFKLSDNANPPTRNYSTDAGLDLYASEDLFVPYETTRVVKTDIAIKIPEGFVGRICDRSSLGKEGLSIGAGVIDSGYSGEICVIIHNLTHHRDNDFTYRSGYHIKKGDKIAQLLIQSVETPEPVEVYELWNSERNDEGFGSSGR